MPPCSAACRIYCTSGRGYYSPQAEVSNSVYSKDFSYFPDGTYCDDGGGKAHYCLNQQCLPEGSRIARAHEVSNINLFGDGDTKIPENIKKFHTLDENREKVQGGSPVASNAEIQKTENEDTLEDDEDYIEINR